VIVRANAGQGVYFTTSSACSPVTSTDGENQIAEFKVSSDLNVLDSGCGVAFDYLVVAGGGGAADAGGGAGGYRSSFPGGTKLFLSPGPNAITVGAGGAGVSPGGPSAKGTDSIAGYIHSTGGGFGRPQVAPTDGGPGGSGGGAGACGGTVEGVGNDPPLSSPTAPVQGFPGGEGPASGVGAGGGGSSAAGSPNNGGPLGARKGGTGTANSITGSPVTYAGGGSGASAPSPGTTVPGGPGGGGDGITGPSPSANTDGDANTGGGGGGAWNGTNGAGGSGVVILRIPAACAPVSLAAAPGTNTITTLPAPEGGCKIATFTVTGTLTV
jgi:hypothetical protein